MRRQRAKRKAQTADQTLAWPEVRRALCPLFFAIFALCPLWFISSSSSKGLEMPVQERARIRAPELSGGRGWLNTDKPLSLAALKGKVVLLDLWLHQLHAHHSRFEETREEISERAGGHRSAFRQVRKRERHRKHSSHYSSLRD